MTSGLSWFQQRPDERLTRATNIVVHLHGKQPPTTTQVIGSRPFLFSLASRMLRCKLFTIVCKVLLLTGGLWLNWHFTLPRDTFDQHQRDRSAISQSVFVCVPRGNITPIFALVVSESSSSSYHFKGRIKSPRNFSKLSRVAALIKASRSPDSSSRQTECYVHCIWRASTFTYQTKSACALRHG